MVSAPSFAPPSTVPIFFLLSVVPSVLSAPPLPPSSSFPPGPPPGFSSFVSSSLHPSSAASFSPWASSASSVSSSWPSLASSSLSSVPSSSVLPPVSSSSSAPSLDFAAYQAQVLDLSAEYQAFGRWYFASGGKNFPAYLSSHFPHLYSDFRLDFSSGSSRFLSALASAPPPPVPVPGPLSSSLPRSSASSSAFSFASPFPSSAFPFSARPLSSVPSSAPPPPLSQPPGFHPSLSSSPYPLRPSAAPPAGALLGVLVSARLGWLRVWIPMVLLLSLLPLSFTLLTRVPLLSLSLPLLWLRCFLPLLVFRFLLLPSTLRLLPLTLQLPLALVLPEDSPPDAVPRVLDPGFAAIPEAVCSEFRRMMRFIVALFPQAARSPSVPPPPRALFEDFFSSSAPSSPIYLNWFERVWSALSEADTRLATFVASGRADFLLLPSRSPVYAVHGDFALGGAAPVNPSVLSLLERRLKPSNHVGLSIREAAAFEASLRSQSEALSHSMWVLSALLAFVQLQNFAPEDSALFNTILMSLSKSLALQANMTATHTAFLGLKRRQFYLSHLPSYFSEVGKRAVLSSPAVLASSLFAESDVARLLCETQTSSFRSQQALVDVVSHGSGACARRSSPGRSPSRASPSRRRSRESGSPSRPQKRVRFDSPAPSSALRGGRLGFRK